MNKQKPPVSISFQKKTNKIKFKHLFAFWVADERLSKWLGGVVEVRLKQQPKTKNGNFK